MTNTMALITGANKGIGFSVAAALGERGMTVLVGARDEEAGRAAEKALQERGADARWIELDVTDADTIRAAAERIDGEFGRLDVLVNNAAITGRSRRLPSEADLDDVRSVLETNVFGVVAVTNALLPLLRRSPAARIVNVSSEVGSLDLTADRNGPIWQMPGASLTYPVSKTALNMVTVQYAKELRETGIKVNAANPGYTRTDLNGNSGFRTPEQGAEPIVHLAVLPADGPSGVLYGYVWKQGSTETEYAVLPW